MKKLKHKSERLICTIIGVMFPHGNDASFEISVQPQREDAMSVYIKDSSVGEQNDTYWDFFFFFSPTKYPPPEQKVNSVNIRSALEPVE